MSEETNNTITTKTKSGKKMSKVDFIRSQASDMTALAVVAEGAKAGIDLSQAYVYNVRASSKKKAPVPGALKRRNLRRKQYAAVVAAKPKSNGGNGQVGKWVHLTGNVPAVKPDGEVETTFRKLALEIGVVQAEAVLSQVHQKFLDTIAALRRQA